MGKAKLEPRKLQISAEILPFNLLIAHFTIHVSPFLTCTLSCYAYKT